MKVSLSVKGIDELTQNLNKIVENQEEVNRLFRKYSCKWIEKKANEILDSSINKDYSVTTDIRTSWKTQEIGRNSTRLTNDSDVASFVEFGTGIVGGEKPHEMADEAGYEYDVKGHGEVGWSFANKRANLYLSGFKGYIGKAYLYQACLEYVNKKIYLEKYKKAFLEVNGRYL